MPHHLIVNAPDSETIHYVLRANRIGLGRGRDNQIQIDCESVSTSHLEISITEEGECWVEDLDSANGTAINGESLYGSYQLKDGDRLLLGDAVGAHYFVPSKMMDASPEFVVEVNSHLSEDLVILGDKVQDFESQIKILKKQYSQKLEEFQTLILALEKLKITVDESSDVEGNGSPPIKALMEELDRTKKELSSKGIQVSDRDLDFSESDSKRPRKLTWFKKT